MSTSPSTQRCSRADVGCRERLAADEFAALRELGEQRLEVGGRPLALLCRQGEVLRDEVAGRVAPRLGVGVDEDDVLHRGSSRSGRPVAGGRPSTRDVGAGCDFSTCPAEGGRRQAYQVTSVQPVWVSGSTCRVACSTPKLRAHHLAGAVEHGVRVGVGAGHEVGGRDVHAGREGPHVQVVDVDDTGDGRELAGHRVGRHAGRCVLAQDGQHLAPQEHGADRDEERRWPARCRCPTTAPPVAATSTPATTTPTEPTVSATTSR